jgi:SAM-dependent methyltransferase
VCGGRRARLYLRSPRLDGPLVRCADCGLLYVGARERDFTFTGGSDVERTQALGARVDALGIVARDVEAAEAGRRAEAERARVARVRRHAPPGGRLLDVGCALGSFLTAAAAGGYAAEGVEPDPGTSAQARAAGLRVTTGTLRDVAAEFDVVTMFHVIEHVDSPRAVLLDVRRRLRPGGVLVIETPTAENLWFALAPARWRQLIPDHYFFFTVGTLSRLLRECGLQPVSASTVGRRVSLRFAADRLRRAGVPGAALAARGVDALGLGDRSVTLNPGDILEVVARAV